MLNFSDRMRTGAFMAVWSVTFEELSGISFILKDECNHVSLTIAKYVTNTWYSQAVSDQGTNQA